MAYDYLLSATYESGYEHVENDQDASPYAPGRNHFYDIIHGEPTKHGHGRMTKFSLLRLTPDADGTYKRWDVDWSALPDDATPLHFMDIQRSIAITGPQDGDSGAYCVARRFGFSYRDENGETITHVEEIDNATGLPLEEAPPAVPPPLLPGEAILVGADGEPLPVDAPVTDGEAGVS